MNADGVPDTVRVVSSGGLKNLVVSVSGVGDLTYENAGLARIEGVADANGFPGDELIVNTYMLGSTKVKRIDFITFADGQLKAIFTGLQGKNQTQQFGLVCAAARHEVTVYKFAKIRGRKGWRRTTSSGKFPAAGADFGADVRSQSKQVSAIPKSQLGLRCQQRPLDG